MATEVISVQTNVTNTQTTGAVTVQSTPNEVELTSTNNAVAVTTNPVTAVVSNSGPEVYEQAYDFVSNTVGYRGDAAAGTATSQAKWRIRKVTISGSITTIEFAGGLASFDKVWDDRLTYGYS